MAETGKKPIVRSKTFWFNVVTAALVFSGYLPSSTAAVILPIANVLLRYLTEQPVSLSLR